MQSFANSFGRNAARMVLCISVIGCGRVHFDPADRWIDAAGNDGGSRLFDGAIDPRDTGAAAALDAEQDAARLVDSASVDAMSPDPCEFACYSYDSTDERGMLDCDGTFQLVPNGPRGGYASFAAPRYTCATRLMLPTRIGEGDQLFLSMYVRLHSPRSGSTQLVMLYDGPEQIAFGAFGPTGLTPEVYVAGGRRGMASSPFDWQPDRWSCVQFHLTNAAAGRVRAWVDGVLAFDLDADTTTPGLGYASLYVGIAYGDPTTPQVDIDELRVGRVPTPCAP